MRLFADRQEAARELANDLLFLKGEDIVVLAIPNGGIPTARIVAETLKAPMDVLMVSRLSAPRKPEHIVGAVDEHGRISLIETTARWHHLTSQKMIEPARQAFKAMQRTRDRFRAVLPEIDVRNKTVIVVSDGVASGAGMLAAISSTKDSGASKVVAAAPAGAEDAIWQLHEAAHMVVIPHKPAKFRGIHKFYKEYDEIDDSAAIEMLRDYARDKAIESPRIRSIPMRFLCGGERTIYCEAELPVGDGPFPTVIFAHGFESDCRSPRSLPISLRLAKRGILGVRLDFRGHGRSDGSINECDHPAMIEDLQTVIENLEYDSRVMNDYIGICGAGSGGRVALDVAAKTDKLKAIVVRGPICQGELPPADQINSPTLMIHCEDDTALLHDVEELDQSISVTHRLLRIPDCNRLFNDPISRELMINASVDWFSDHLLNKARADGAVKTAASVDTSR